MVEGVKEDEDENEDAGDIEQLAWPMYPPTR